MTDNRNAKIIQSIINSMPLEEIINTAEAIAPLIPAVGSVLYAIIKILKVLLAIKPAAVRTTDIITQKTEEDIKAKRETFNRMWNIAITDGVITDDEKKYLRPHALAAGILDDEFELMVINKININQ